MILKLLERARLEIWRINIFFYKRKLSRLIKDCEEHLVQMNAIGFNIFMSPKKFSESKQRIEAGIINLKKRLEDINKEEIKVLERFGFM